MPPPWLTCPQVHATKSCLTLSAPYLDRSTRPPTCSKFGSTENSTWPRSGALPACSALNILAYVPASPEVVSSSFTWMSGCSLFHRLTDWAMPGTHDQNVRVTLPPLALAPLPVLALAPVPEDEPPLLQAARARAPAATATASSRRRPRCGARLPELRSEDDMRCYLLILPAARPRRGWRFRFGSVPNRMFPSR